MTTRSEEFTIEDGSAFLDIQGSDFDQLLCGEGKPVALAWPDCAGSICQYLARAGTPCPSPKLESLRHILDGNLQDDVPLYAQLYPFLELLAPDTYTITYYDAVEQYDLFTFEESWDPARDHDNFYPWGHSLVLTRPSDLLSRQRILHWGKAIAAGQRPIAITLSMQGSDCEFVVDGHHKLIAYRELEAHPALLRITRSTHAQLPSATLASLTSKKHPLARHYKKVKAQIAPHADGWKD